MLYAMQQIHHTIFKYVLITDSASQSVLFVSSAHALFEEERRRGFLLSDY